MQSQDGRLIFRVFIISVISSGLVLCNLNEPKEIEIGHHGKDAAKNESQLVLKCNVTVYRAGQPAYANWTFLGIGPDAKQENVTDKSTMNTSSQPVLSFYDLGPRIKSQGVLAVVGDYNCLSYNNITMNRYNITTAPMVSDTAKSIVRIRENFYRNGMSYVWYEDENQNIECAARGNPRPRFRWYVINKNIDDVDDLIDAGKEIVKDDDKRLSANESTLYFRGVQQAHHGFYLCIAISRLEPELYIFYRVRVKSHLAPLWPFLVLVSEIIILVLILVLCECRRRKNAKDETVDEGHVVPAHSMASHSKTASGSGSGSDLRQRSGVQATVSKKGK